MAIETSDWDDWDELDAIGRIPITCPHCNLQATLDDFDCIGAPDGKVFCNRCYELFGCQRQIKKGKKHIMAAKAGQKELFSQEQGDV